MKGPIFLMLNNLRTILAEVSNFPKRQMPVISEYIQFLTLRTKRHSFKGAGEASGLHESRFCSLLNEPETLDLSLKILNRATRRRLKKLKPVDGRYTIIIDATIKGRRGKKVENIRKYHSGNSFVTGHKFINFIILTPSGPIPLASVPAHTHQYCRDNNIDYRTENEIVEDLVFQFQESGILSKTQLKKAVFLLDSGYDTKKIQQAIREIGSNFVSALKSNRTIQGKQVREYFCDKRRWLPWKPIRLQIGNGGKKSRRKYSIRTATQVNLKGFGSVTVVCSKALSRARKPTKYLAASDPKMTGRQIVEWYSRRWAIELWHKEIKQHYGFGDCHSARFSAIAAHVNFTLTAYLLQKETGREQMGIEKYILFKELKEIKKDLSQFGSITRIKNRVYQVIQDIAA